MKMRSFNLVLLFLLGSLPGLAEEGGDFDSARLTQLVRNEAASKIHWDSQKHFHVFPSPALKIEVHAWANLIEERPGVFLRILNKLSKEDLRALTTDDLSRRNDWLDVFSIAIKEEVQARWSPLYERYPFNRSQLWSLAKTKLRNLYSQKPSEDGLGVSLFRKADAESLDFVLGCVDEAPSISGPWQDGEPLSFGGLHFVEFKFDSDKKGQDAQASLKCGSRNFQLTAASLQDWPTPIPESVPWIPREEGSKEISVLATIGLTNHVSTGMLTATQLYLRLIKGYKLISEEDVHLKEALAEGLKKADLFLPAIIMADANHFRFGLASARATRLIFEKSISPRTIRLEILLPPNDKRESDKSLILTQTDLADFLKVRSTLPVIIDLSCFSQKYLMDWLAVFSLSRIRRDSSVQEFQSPSIITSERGHAGESSFQIILVMDQILGAIDRLATDVSWREIEEYLDGAGGLTRYWNFFSRLVESRNDWESSSFQASRLGSPPFDYVQNFKKWSSIQLTTNGDIKRVYLPQLLGASN